MLIIAVIAIVVGIYLWVEHNKAKEPDYKKMYLKANDELLAISIERVFGGLPEPEPLKEPEWLKKALGQGQGTDRSAGRPPRNSST